MAHISNERKLENLLNRLTRNESVTLGLRSSLQISASMGRSADFCSFVGMVNSDLGCEALLAGRCVALAAGTGGGRLLAVASSMVPFAKLWKAVCAACARERYSLSAVDGDRRVDVLGSDPDAVRRLAEFGAEIVFGRRVRRSGKPRRTQRPDGRTVPRRGGRV